MMNNDDPHNKFSDDDLSIAEYSPRNELLSVVNEVIGHARDLCNAVKGDLTRTTSQYGVSQYSLIEHDLSLMDVSVILDENSQIPSFIKELFQSPWKGKIVELYISHIPIELRLRGNLMTFFKTYSNDINILQALRYLQLPQGTIYIIGTLTAKNLMGIDFEYVIPIEPLENFESIELLMHLEEISLSNGVFEYNGLDELKVSNDTVREFLNYLKNNNRVNWEFSNLILNLFCTGLETN